MPGVRPCLQDAPAGWLAEEPAPPAWSASGGVAAARVGAALAAGVVGCGGGGAGGGLFWQGLVRIVGVCGYCDAGGGRAPFWGGAQSSRCQAEDRRAGYE